VNPAIDAVIFDVGGVLTHSPFNSMVGHAVSMGVDPRVFARIAVGHGSYDDGTYRTAICTNNVRPWAAWRDHVPTDGFDVVVDSCEVGLRKPEAAIYRLVAERLAVDVERCLMLDDFVENVDGARAVGMQAILVDETSAARESALRMLQVST
jgi:FMN phosphatase YigB (HAD superfamily)